jgi:hypothetical protein
MSPKQQNLLDLAQQGDINALITLMNRSLRHQGITVKASFKDNCLKVLFESAEIPDKHATIAKIIRGIKQLEVRSITTLKVYGKKLDEKKPSWVEQVAIEPLELTATNASNVPERNQPQVVADETGVNTAPVQLTSRLPEVTPLPDPKPSIEVNWYETRSHILIVGLLIIFFPLGLWSMWKHARWTTRTKGFVTAGIALILLTRIDLLQPLTTRSPASSTSPSSATPAPSSPSNQRVFIGRNELGHEIWADEDCIILKGIREYDLKRLNTDIFELKRSIKAETGVQCVLFE